MLRQEKHKRYVYIKHISNTMGFIDPQDIFYIIPPVVLFGDIGLAAADVKTRLADPGTFQFYEIRRAALLVGIDFISLALAISAKIAKISGKMAKARPELNAPGLGQEPIHKEKGKRWMESSGKTFYKLFNFIAIGQMAADLDIKDQELRKLVNDPVLMTFSQLQKIAGLIGVPLDVLVEVVVEQIEALEQTKTGPTKGGTENRL